MLPHTERRFPNENGPKLKRMIAFLTSHASLRMAPYDVILHNHHYGREVANMGSRDRWTTGRRWHVRRTEFDDQGSRIGHHRFSHRLDDQELHRACHLETARSGETLLGRSRVEVDSRIRENRTAHAKGDRSLTPPKADARHCPVRVERTPWLSVTLPRAPPGHAPSLTVLNWLPRSGRSRGRIGKLG